MSTPLSWATADQYKVVHDLSIYAIFNDLNDPPNPDFKVTPIFDAEYFSIMVEDRDIFTMENE